MEVEIKTKKWGNSIGVVIPKEILEKQKIKENETVIVSIKKKLLVSEVFGTLKGWKRPTQEIKDEMRKGWK
mgnify:CR=1 FL=1